MGEPLYKLNAANPASGVSGLYWREVYTVVYKALSGPPYLNRYRVASLYKRIRLCEAYRAMPVRVGALMGHAQSEITATRHIEPA